MVRETSLEAYRDLENELGERQVIVFNAIKKIQPATDMEICKELNKGDPNYVRPRRNELVKIGLVVESDKRPCSITKRKAITWVVKSVTETNKDE